MPKKDKNYIVAFNPTALTNYKHKGPTKIFHYFDEQTGNEAEDPTFISIREDVLLHAIAKLDTNSLRLWLHMVAFNNGFTTKRIFHDCWIILLDDDWFYVTKNAVAKDLGIAPSSVSNAIEQLREAGFLKANKEGGLKLLNPLEENVDNDDDADRLFREDDRSKFLIEEKSYDDDDEYDDDEY